MKMQKDEVGYDKGHLHSHCGPMFHDDKFYCTHFLPGASRTGRCEKVEGGIMPEMWCELYKRTSAT